MIIIDYDLQFQIKTLLLKTLVSVTQCNNYGLLIIVSLDIKVGHFPFTHVEFIDSENLDNGLDS